MNVLYMTVEIIGSRSQCEKYRVKKHAILLLNDGKLDRFNSTYFQA